MRAGTQVAIDMQKGVIWNENRKSRFFVRSYQSQRLVNTQENSRSRIFEKWTGHVDGMKLTRRQISKDLLFPCTRCITLDYYTLNATQLGAQQCFAIIIREDQV